MGNKYKYIPRTVESRPIYAGGKRVVVDVNKLEVTTTKTNEGVKTLKPYDVRNYKVIAVSGKKTGTPSPTTTTTTTIVVNQTWENATSQWNNTTETWNTI